MSNPTNTSGAMAHTDLPRWLEAFRDTFLLFFLLVADAYLLGDAATTAWVPSVDDPTGWGIFRGIGVILFFVAGAAAATLGVSCSVAAARYTIEKRWFFALITGIGVLLFTGSEVWVSISSRSNNLQPSPADQAVQSFLGLPHGSLYPTLLVVAFLLPLATLYYGFVRVKRQEKTPAEIEEDKKRKLAQESMRQELMMLKTKGRAARMGTFGKTLVANATNSGTETAEIDAANTVSTSEGNSDVVVDQDSHNNADQPRTPTGKDWTWKQFQQYIKDNLGVITEDQAKMAVQTVGKGRTGAMPGAPYVADVKSLKTYARRHILQSIRLVDDRKRA